MYQALSHPARRQVLKLLGQGPMAAGDIAERFAVAKPTMSGHFKVLKDAGLIQPERDGNTIRYRLNVSVLEEAAAAILDLVGAGGRAEGLQSGPEAGSELAPSPGPEPTLAPNPEPSAHAPRRAGPAPEGDPS